MSYFTFNLIDHNIIICLLTSPVVPVALTFLTNSSYTSFLTFSLSTTSLNLFQSVVTGFKLSASNLSTLLFKLLKPLGTFSNSTISNLSKSDFKLTKSAFLANFDVSTFAVLFKLDFVA